MADRDPRLLVEPLPTEPIEFTVKRFIFINTEVHILHKNDINFWYVITDLVSLFSWVFIFCKYVQVGMKISQKFVWEIFFVFYELKWE